MKRLFISSVQKEFAAERAALREYLKSDPLLRGFFEPFLFEDVPAADRRKGLLVKTAKTGRGTAYKLSAKPAINPPNPPTSKAAKNRPNPPAAGKKRQANSTNLRKKKP